MTPDLLKLVATLSMQESFTDLSEAKMRNHLQVLIAKKHRRSLQ